ncbi:hypothetical protein LVJ82_17160 [Vitreoscilla massiliensis]|uniref:DUF3303 domain-containing protein n=1 Tax=Vitreoscilla massiliensis TaxID=1689272 RepID=A0ABY4E1N5_9NEIS|nr:hypothetical protein [Vitreoscilla massiliensis]UOO89149.1 hypothetical protein LVJ82_17160 [Vitreoscilla massiliensis]
MKLFWCSWEQKSNDYRPLTYPPNENILGWWCSGFKSDGWPILCAWVSAVSEEQAFNKVKEDWPELESWKFITCKSKFEFYDRFPLEDWMKPRVENLELK